MPVQAVVRVGGEPTVYLRRGGGLEPQSISIGLDNNSMVHVLAGLEPGQEVSLTPPLETKAEAEEPQLAAAQVVGPAEAATAQAKPQPADGPAQTGPRRPQGGGDRDEAAEGGMTSERGEGGRRGPTFGDMTPEQREELRRRFQNMSPEEREEMMRKRLESMSPEERQEFERQRKERQPGGGDGGGGR